MKKKSLIISVLLIFVLFLLFACSPAPTPAPAVPSAAAAAAVQSSDVPPTPMPTQAPTPTAAPPLPCNITFESDRDGNPEIYVMGPDGSNQVNLSNNPAEDSNPVWSPDGSRIAFVSNRESETGGGQFIYVMQADGRNVQQLSKQNESKYPDWSPDGSHIVYNDKGDIYLVNLSDGSEVNLSNSPENDEQPKFSPDSQRIAWIKGEGKDTAIFTMNLQGGDVQQVTHAGKVNDLEWTVDGRLFSHWENPEGVCFNCLLSADGKQVSNAGGKGDIQQYLPFWTLDHQRVEMASGPGPQGDEEIFLVGNNFDGMFLYLTQNPANDRNPDAPFGCGGEAAAPQPAKPAEAGAQPSGGKELVIGYEDGDNLLTTVMQQDLDQACSELGIKCIRGENMRTLLEQKVNAILSVSNRWHVLGTYPDLHEAASQGVPVFVLNAESGEPGIYNLSAENEVVTATLKWMFTQMGGQGDFVYLNFGQSDYYQVLIDSSLKQFPNIKTTGIAVDFNKPYTQADFQTLIEKSPAIDAVWSSDFDKELFWGINSAQSDHLPLANCTPRMEILTNWKNAVDGGSSFKCLAFVKPGGTAYEGVYAAYYFLNGLKFKPDALVGEGHNTLKYDLPEINNETLPDWLMKLDQLRENQAGVYELPPMSPEEIKTKWFVE
ncbi:MAG: DPP IV N-terminal domain-containing protein [Anaerolineae bacterium]|nr:DPP IV N-terminal domain-containing protein [Anaerolineae bacterium]